MKVDRNETIGVEARTEVSPWVYVFGVMINGLAKSCKPRPPTAAEVQTILNPKDYGLRWKDETCGSRTLYEVVKFKEV